MVWKEELFQRKEMLTVHSISHQLKWYVLLSQEEYVIDRVKWLYDHRHLIGGLRFVHEPKTLRFFTGKLEAVSDWPEKLIEAYIADFGEDQ